jgi:hypothetical protein
MATQGQTRDVAINPVTVKNTDPIETLVPAHIDIRNARLSDLRNFVKRFGFGEQWDTGVDNPVDLLIPRGNGYAVQENNRLFYLNDTPTELTGIKLTGEYRPTWEDHYNTLIVCDGGVPVKLTSTTAAVLGGDPPNGRFISSRGDYAIMSGFSAVSPVEGRLFRYSAAGDPEDWPAENFKSMKYDGDIIRHNITHKELIYFFTDTHIETWSRAGATFIFARNDQLWVDIGIRADDSVVIGNEQIHFLGEGPDFYVLKGSSAEVISTLYSDELRDLVSPESIYGFDFRNERVIKWIAPIDGRCFIWDYRNKRFFEDNIWQHAQFGRMPINSHMRLGDEEFFGTYDHTGKIFKSAKEFTDDNGLPIRAYRQFLVQLSVKGYSANVNEVGFRVKRGVATDSVTDPQFVYKFRFDGGPWQTRQLSLGQLGDYDNWVYDTNLGVGREAEFIIFEADEVEFILTKMNMTVQELSR